MLAIEFEVSQLIPAMPEAIYQAWLSSEGHTAMTGSPATASDAVGEAFEAWDGYIQGRNLELEAPKRIVQSWRTAEFEASEEDSRLEILLTPQGEGTLVTLRHSQLPEQGMQYKQGWVDSYFLPMLAFFGEGAEESG
ncbi:MAG: SRPBCC domain-containing protein [Candidatus Neomarinimicrobiota bacterium]